MNKNDEDERFTNYCRLWFSLLLVWPSPLSLSGKVGEVRYLVAHCGWHLTAYQFETNSTTGIERLSIASPKLLDIYNIFNSNSFRSSHQEISRNVLLRPTPAPRALKTRNQRIVRFPPSSLVPRHPARLTLCPSIFTAGTTSTQPKSPTTLPTPATSAPFGSTTPTPKPRSSNSSKTFPKTKASHNPIHRSWISGAATAPSSLRCATRTGPDAHWVWIIARRVSRWRGRLLPRRRTMMSR